MARTKAKKEKTFAELLQDYNRNKRIFIGQLADACGITRKRMHAIYNGAIPTPDEQAAIVLHIEGN